MSLLCDLFPISDATNYYGLSLFFGNCFQFMIKKKKVDSRVTYYTILYINKIRDIIYASLVNGNMNSFFKKKQKKQMY